MSLRARAAALVPSHAREGGIVLIGDVFAKSLTFLITLVLLRLVTPDEYAIYGLFITILATVNQFTDSGLHQSFIRFYAFYAGSDPGRAALHFRVALRAKLAVIAVTSLVLLAGAPVLAEDLLRTPGLVAPIRLLALGVIGSGLFEFSQAAFQARQQFRALTVLRVSEGAGKIILIAAIALTGAFSLDGVFLSYVAVPLVVGFIGTRAVIAAIPRVPMHDWRHIASEIFSFGKWMMVTSFATMFLMRLDVFMVAPMLADRPYDVGLYNAAVRLCTPLIVLTGSVSTVFFPKAMALRTREDMTAYVRKTLQVTLPLVLASCVYLVALWFAIPAYFPKYAGAFPMFAILFLGYAWTIIGNPLTMLLLSLNRAATVTIISLIQLIVTLGSHYLFITHLGAIGAAISTVLVWFLAGIVSMAYIYGSRDRIARTMNARHATGDPS